MHITSQEMQQVAAAQGAPRFDMYGTIHKALRAFMADTLLAVGRMDVDDEPELVRTLQRVFDLLEFCHHHVQHENGFVHPAMEGREPGSSARIGAEHDEHLAHITRLSAMAGGVLRVLPNARPAAAMALYHALSAFVAHNFEHMLQEELEHNAVLQARYSDPELLEIHGALVASIAPADMMVVMRWMVPFMNPAERTMVLADMQAHAPAPAFEAVLDTVRPHLDEAEWAKLTRSLGLAAVPGLAVA